MKWMVNKHVKKLPKVKDAVLVEGLPGIGNVGKIAVDFIVDELKPTKLYTIHCHDFPHTVYVNEENTVDLHSVSVYHLKNKRKDIIFVAGDVQPMEEGSNYAFSEKILDIAQEFNCSEVITLGGIGLPGEVKDPNIYCAATDDKSLADYKKRTKNVSFDTYQRVSAIVGATGLLLGLGRLRNMTGAALLIETFAHPGHYGFKESEVLIRELENLLGIQVDMNSLNKSIKDSEREDKRLDKMSERVEKRLMKRLKSKMDENGEVSYIG